MTKEEGNKIIGDFMGKNFKDPLNYMYDNDWNWLMPVVEKIEEIGYKFKMCRRRVEIEKDEKGVEYLPMITKKEETKIQSAWQAIVQFLLWYNNNKQ